MTNREDRFVMYLILGIVALIVAAAFLIGCTPAEAAARCMTQAQARQVHRTSHLYWHGAGHCWDATPVERHHARATVPRRGEGRAARTDERQTVGATVSARPKLAAREDVEPIKPDRVRSIKIDAPPAPPVVPAWANAMAMIPMPDEPEATADWIDRWPEMKPAEPRPPAVIERATAEAPIMPARNAIMAIVLAVLCAALIEVALGGHFEQRRIDRRDGYFT